MSETDCKEYLIEGSTDGLNFNAIGSVLFKAPNGNSNQPLSYEFTTAVPGSLVAGLFISLLLIPVFRSRMVRVILVVVFLGFVGACIKGSKEINRDVTQLYVRIVQQNNTPG